MKSKKFFNAFILSLFLLPFVLGGGLMRNREIDEQYIVASLAFGGKDGRVSVVAETVSVGPNTETSAPRIFSGEGESVTAAVRDLKNEFPRDVFFDHCAVIVLDGSLDKKTEKAALQFCGEDPTINFAALVVKSADAESLLSCESEYAAVGYDIKGILKRTDYGDNAKLLRVLQNKGKILDFENRHGVPAREDLS